MSDRPRISNVSTVIPSRFDTDSAFRQSIFSIVSSLFTEPGKVQERFNMEALS